MELAKNRKLWRDSVVAIGPEDTCTMGLGFGRLRLDYEGRREHSIGKDASVLRLFSGIETARHRP